MGHCCFALICVFSSFVIISLGTRELVAILLLYSDCHVAVINFYSSSWCHGVDCGITWSYSLTFCIAPSRYNRLVGSCS